jgi:hypothetical protein
LRAAISLKAQVVAVLSCNAADSVFQYDELAWQLKVRRLSALIANCSYSFAGKKGCWWSGRQGRIRSFPSLSVAFSGTFADIFGAAPDGRLRLTDGFRQRYLQDGREWQRDICPKAMGFLRAAVKRSPKLWFILDAHASITFLARAVLDLQRGVETQLVQKGRVGARTWRADDGSTTKGGRD